MTSLINKVSSGIVNFVQDCKELKHCSQMENGEITKRIASIMLRVSAAAIATYGAYQIVNFASYFSKSDYISISVPKHWCVTQIKNFDTKCSTIPLSAECLNLKNSNFLQTCRYNIDHPVLSSIIRSTAVGIFLTPISIIAAMIPLKLNSMITDKPTKPDCKSVHRRF